MTTTASSSLIPAADARPTATSPVLAATAHQAPSDFERVNRRQSMIDIVGELRLADLANDGAPINFSPMRAGVVSTPEQATLGVRQTATSPTGVGGRLCPDLLAALFENANFLAPGSTPAAEHSASDTDVSLMGDDLLEAISQRWQGTTRHTNPKR